MLTAFKFARKTNASFFDGTYSVTVATGAMLTSKTISAKRLVLLATTCAACGTVQVKWRGAVVGTVSLCSATTRHKVVIPVALLPALQAGVAQIVTLSAGRVEIDGLGASRN